MLFALTTVICTLALRLGRPKPLVCMKSLNEYEINVHVGERGGQFIRLKRISDKFNSSL
jgi:hypothetical protein